MTWNSGNANVSKQIKAYGSAAFRLGVTGKDTVGYPPNYKTDWALTYQVIKETAKLIPENQKVYEQLFARYLRLHDYFGRAENNVMKTLKKIRAEVKHGSR